MTTLHVVTANAPGAIALIQLHGQDTMRILRSLTGHGEWPARRVRLSRFADIDEGLAAALSADTAQLMPHGGPRVVQRMVERLVELGCAVAHEPDPRHVYPEAASPIEADVLHAVAVAQSPAAIDLLAGQPARWRRLLRQAGDINDVQRRRAIAARSRILGQLITPPTVVVAGPANVGKSTLTNALMGRAVSIVADLPGTTRDWVGGVVELSADFGFQISDFRLGDEGGPEPGGRPATDPADQKSEIVNLKSLVAVRWLDTPGLRASDDAVEQRAIALARSVVQGADVLVAMRDPASAWPGEEALPRTPDLWVMNKCDEAQKAAEQDDGRTPGTPLRISAEHGHGLPALQHAVLSHVGLTALDDETPWAFSPTLQAWSAGESVDLDRYLRTR